MISEVSLVQIFPSTVAMLVTPYLQYFKMPYIFKFIFSEVFCTKMNHDECFIAIVYLFVDS